MQCHPAGERIQHRPPLGRRLRVIEQRHEHPGPAGRVRHEAGQAHGVAQRAGLQPRNARGGAVFQAAQPDEPTRQAAERAVRAWFAAHGLDDRGLVLDNGSGLSRSERISPAQMAGLLRAA
ncbi:MAG: hypothetical protein EOO64_00740, partial [Massilia sp.]